MAEGSLTLKRLILGLLTLLAIVLLGSSLFESWNKPQIQSRLELYQTNLILHAAEWQPQPQSQASDKTSDKPSSGLQLAQTTLLGGNPYQLALEQYQEVRQSAQKNLERLQEQSQGTDLSSDDRSSASQQLKTLLVELDLRIGLLQVQQNQVEKGLQTWDSLKQSAISASPKPSIQASVRAAEVLSGFWSNPPRLLPDAEPRVQAALEGWFRYAALSRLYTLQQRQELLQTLQTEEQQLAEQAFWKVILVAGLPVLAVTIGTGILIFLIVQRFVKGQQSWLAQTQASWNTPWTGETIWQVFIVGFFLMGQILVPILLGFLRLNPAAFTERERAFYIFATYALVAAGGLGVLYFSLRPFMPLPEGWFQAKWQGNWIGWGLGGYFTALPLVIVVSLINQKFWQGQGGSNPILPLALQGKDNIAIALFLITACLAAPLFEELMFRGFLLPSLTRDLPEWGAITGSSFLFAIAHLNLSEVLPLFTLGVVLGFVYTRTRNLLAPMLLHSLWNSGTLLSLFILGSGGN